MLVTVAGYIAGQPPRRHRLRAAEPADPAVGSGQWLNRRSPVTVRGAPPRAAGLRRRIWRRFRRRPAAMAGLVLVVVFLLLAIVGPLLTADPAAQDYTATLAPPSGGHLARHRRPRPRRAGPDRVRRAGLAGGRRAVHAAGDGRRHPDRARRRLLPAVARPDRDAPGRRRAGLPVPDLRGGHGRHPRPVAAQRRHRAQRLPAARDHPGHPRRGPRHPRDGLRVGGRSPTARAMAAIMFRYVLPNATSPLHRAGHRRRSRRRSSARRRCPSWASACSRRRRRGA